jgi:hypothetical protein
MLKKKFNSMFLFTTPSFWGGAGSVMNVAGNYYEFNDSPTGQEADQKALACDWGMVGQDVSYAVNKLRREIDEANKNQLVLFDE